MTDTDEGRTSGAAGFAMEPAPGASAAPTSPMPAPSESSSAGSGSSSSTDGRSDLLEKIKELQDTQKALKEQKKKCALEMKNAMKRKKRLQVNASQLSDSDLVEVLRMRRAKKEGVQAVSSTQPSEASRTDQ